MKILFRISFKYKWNNYANIKSHYEYLQKLGYDVDLSVKKENPKIDYDKYDLIMLHGSGAYFHNEEYNQVKCPIIGFGWSDPSMFNNIHYHQSTVYCSNDLEKTKILHDPIAYYYQTACDKRYHVNLNLNKETDILVYGAGDHRFVTNRNTIVNKLRKEGFRIKVFGRGWDKHTDTYGFIEGHKLSVEVCKAHLLLDLVSKTSSWAHRVLESSARATPAFSIDRKDTRLMFKDNKEIILFSDFQMLIDKLAYYLNHKDKLKKIGINAQKRCLKSHDISIRIKELQKIIKTLK